MMPLSPSPSLKFRTARFPRYGFKADISDGAFPFITLLKLAPSMRRPMSVCLHPSRPMKSETSIPVLSREVLSLRRRHVGFTALPQGSSLRSGRVEDWRHRDRTYQPRSLPGAQGLLVDP